MKYEDFPVPFLGVLKRPGEKTLQQTLLCPGVYCPLNMPPFILIGKTAVQDSVAINLAVKVPFKKIIQLKIERVLYRQTDNTACTTPRVKPVTQSAMLYCLTYSIWRYAFQVADADTFLHQWQNILLKYRETHHYSVL